jgi:nitric oxide synthase-interacting protein
VLVHIDISNLLSQTSRQLAVMGRHGKDDGGVHTREERRLVHIHGSKRMRLGSDSIRQFDHCCLGLAPPRTPVVTKQGFLYDKQAILENLLIQKNAAKSLQAQTAGEELLSKAASRQVDAQNGLAAAGTFASRHDSVSSLPFSAPAPFTQDLSAPISREQAGETLTGNFWLNTPATVPQSRRSNNSSRTRCPVTSRPLRARVRFLRLTTDACVRSHV